jgi:hypothetical protein
MSRSNSTRGRPGQKRFQADAATGGGVDVSALQLITHPPLFPDIVLKLDNAGENKKVNKRPLLAPFEFKDSFVRVAQPIMDVARYGNDSQQLLLRPDQVVLHSMGRLATDTRFAPAELLRPLKRQLVKSIITNNNDFLPVVVESSAALSDSAVAEPKTTLDDDAVDKNEQDDEEEEAPPEEEDDDEYEKNYYESEDESDGGDAEATF